MVHAPLHRCGARLAIAGALALAACAAPAPAPKEEYVWPRPQADTRNDLPATRAQVARLWIADCTSHDLGRCASGFANEVVAIDGQRVVMRHDGSTRYVELAVGAHQVLVATRWSNGSVSLTPLPLQAQPAARDWLLAYEARDAAQAATARAWRRVPESKEPSMAAQVGAYSLALILAPIIVPAGVLALPWIREERAQRAAAADGTLPFEGCCWQWVESQDGQALAGVPPPGQRPLPSR